jgi:hypothetical protein
MDVARLVDRARYAWNNPRVITVKSEPVDGVHDEAAPLEAGPSSANEDHTMTGGDHGSTSDHETGGMDQVESQGSQE